MQFNQRYKEKMVIMFPSRKLGIPENGDTKQDQNIKK